MTSSFGKICITLVLVAVIAGNVTDEIAPLAVLACVAFAVFCVSQGLRR